MNCWWWIVLAGVMGVALGFRLGCRWQRRRGCDSPVHRLDRLPWDRK